jgi:hypothetical protein
LRVEDVNGAKSWMAEQLHWKLAFLTLLTGKKYAFKKN